MVFLPGARNQRMGTIAAYESDIRLQPGFLGSFRGQPMIPAARQARVLFAGSGDSLAASMLAESFSGGRARAVDPLDLYRNPRLAEGKTVYFVSVSGKTAANVRAAGAVPESVAVTADPSSRLARACSRSIQLDFPSSGALTAGSVGFLASALTCASLVSRISLPGAGRILARAEAAARGSSVTGSVFVLGGFHTYPLAMYCAAKFGEVLGAAARYCRTEQFSHMELFAAREGDTVIVLDDPTAYNRRLAGHLRSEGIGALLPGPASGSMISKILFYAFYSQLLPLYGAKAAGRDDCHFVLAGGLRGISDRMIY